MATDDKSETVEGSWSPKRPRTAAEKRATSHEGTMDTEVLASDIEKTREELAETLDAIVDKVSPKKVAKRTTRKAGAAAREGVHDAAEAVKETVASVKEKVSGTGDAAPRSPLQPAASVEVGSASSLDATPDPAATTALPLGSPLPAGTLSVDAGAVLPVDTTGSLADAAEAAAPSVEPAGADLPPYRPVAAPMAPAPSKLPVVAGAAAALVVVLLVLRRRRR